VGRAGFALAHNGNLTNTAALAEAAGMLPGIVASDSDLMAELISRAFPPESDGTGGEGPPGRELDLAGALGEVLAELGGAFALGAMDAGRLYAARDPHGFRPLCIGRFTYLAGGEERTGWAISSESAALQVIGAELVRSVSEGELVVIDSGGPRSVHFCDECMVAPRLCVFELVYFARPDTVLGGREVYSARRKMGELLAHQAPVGADLVIGVPDSGVTAAEGYAIASGIPFGQGLVKNRYIGRTFIAPTQEARALGVRRKLNPLREAIRGKRLVVVDDSIVRGTTTGQIVRMLREAGASEVHLRISSPPFRWPCFFGIDTPARDELIAARLTEEGVRAHVGADSLAYLSLEHLLEAVAAPGGAGGAGYCRACLTGVYPAPVPVGLDELDASLESGAGPPGAASGPVGGAVLASARR
ncbi:MAG: amidophosphoribosyltransferase, partial [Acidimicrobiales bacterium]